MRRARKGLTLSPAAQWAITIGAISAAWWIRFSLSPFLETRLAYATFLTAVAVAARYGGAVHGVLATIAGLFIATYVFTPRGPFGARPISSTRSGT